MSYKKIILMMCASLFLLSGRSVAQSVTFSYLASQQTWTVPACVAQITVTAIGASGGGEAYQGPNYGGNRATMVGLVKVTPGDVIHIYTGGEGSTNYNYDGGAGGGGTFVYDATTSTLLEVAGGGGGSFSYTYNGYNASTTTTPTGQNGGTGELGGGAVAVDAGGGGAGFLGNGASNGSEAGTGGMDFANGFIGGPGDVYAGDQISVGGYGGGGGTGYSDGGGGGGYAGGGSGAEDGGGGGSSYVNGTIISATALDTGYGSVTIKWVPNVVSTNTGNVISNVTCHGGNNGKASGIVPAVLPSAFTYSWAPSGGSKDTATGLAAGSYTLTVHDACGHSATAAVTITQPAALSASATVTANVLCNGGSNGSLLANVTGGTTPYTYSWSPAGGNANTASGLSAGIYALIVNDACGASASATTAITQPNLLAVTAKGTNVDCYGKLDGTAQAAASGGSLPYTYAWTPAGGTAANIFNMSAGVYSVAVTDNNGCTGSAYVIISQPAAALTTSVAATANVLCNGKNTGSIGSSTSGGTGPYRYAWTGGGTKDTLMGLSIGSYTLTVTDAHGCVVSEATTITEPSAVTVISMQTPDNGGCTGSAWVMVNGGVIPYTYLWNPGGVTSAYNYNVCGTTKYCCTITDAHGCSQVACDSVENGLGVAGISSGAGKVMVYPNPNNGQFTIQSTGINGQSSIEIYNVLGEKIYATSLNAGGNTSININNQPNGIYLYRVLSTENGSLVGEGKLILNK